MAKGYWITFYRSISDPAALAAYAKLAGPALTSNGGHFLARGGTAKTYESSVKNLDSADFRGICGDRQVIAFARRQRLSA